MFETAREGMVKAMTDTISPLANGSRESMATAVKFAAALRGIQYQFKLVDDALVKHFPPAERVTMGRAQDEQSVLEQHIRNMRDANAANAG